MIWTVSLTPRQRFGFFLVMSLLFVFPLILADYSYIDDNWRLFEAGTGWLAEGRFMMELLYNGLSFTAAAPNIFPLPLLIATLCMALALNRLSLDYFDQPTVVDCLVVLPLLYTPFLLQALSYQYDGAGVLLGIVLVVYSITFRHRLLFLRVLLSAVLLALALGFYQLTINVFVGLCCIEVLRALLDRVALKDILQALARRLLQMLFAALLYFLCVFLFMSHERTSLLPLNAEGLATVASNFLEINRTVAQVLEGGAGWMTLVLLVLCAICLLKVIVHVAASDEGGVARMLRVCLIIGAAFVLFFSLSGAGLFFRDFNDGARTLLGATALLLGLFCLTHRLLREIHPALNCLLIVPVLYMLSFSYAYGRLLVVQKEFENSMTLEVVHDIDRHVALRNLKMIYVQPSDFDLWLPGGERSMALIPALKYVRNINDYLVLPESLQRFGIVSEWLQDPDEMARLAGLQGSGPLIDRRFYAIYSAGDRGYIVFKHVQPPQGQPD
ncbi:glucosyltransferase domain-containing protein [Pseudomonas vanderleydeniana]|uniref:Glucosyltransferase domain-containing protein n=1 Tax=Pseudomonas vanderleydeniana TaxID=2745495 RepID=A0A9E6PJS5_9PSED|nr:glucosyltransferase domain-containing protein [Pseudomonas vanderleydeniana]QXI27535.1 glucosyltransferase domain-containing protein [Pseudomonas vanderleydeniana]